MTTRPGKYIEYDFPLHEVNRLAVKEANAKKPIYTMHKWWARRLSCVFRTILLASAIDWEDWDHLEPWQRDADGDFVNPDGEKVTDERQYHRRTRRPGVNNAWERLYYRLDDEANAVIRWSFTKPKGQEKNGERLAEHLGSLGVSLDDTRWWQAIDWEAREPITVLDPFMGGGTTVVEALRLGANVVGVDLNPVAWFVVKKETDGCDLDALQAAFERVEAAVAEEIKQYYRTTCPCCGGQADVMYVFWVKLAPCFERTCKAHQQGRPVPLYNSFVIAQKKGGKTREADVPRNKDGKPGMKLVEGPDRGIRYIKCPNPDCGEVYASKERPADNRSTCPACGASFDPEQGYAGNGKYTCAECGVTHDIIEAAKANVPEGMDRNTPLPHQMYAVELYCPHCEFKGYKPAEAADDVLFSRVAHRLRDIDGALPDEEIPEHGVNTKYAGNDLWSHGYRKWRELFNDRQLVCLSLLLEAIGEIEDHNVQEYLLSAWSAALETNNMFCRYEAPYRKLVNMYYQHAIVPTNSPVENNVWGTRYGRGTFRAQFAQVAAGVAYWARTYDNFFTSDDDYGKVQIDDSVAASDASALLRCRSSEDLSGTMEESADLCITDPPYYGNVMYSELSDFFHVWLRLILAARYPDIFGPNLTPKEEEIIENAHWVPKRGQRTEAARYLTKDDAFFTTGLTRIFREAADHIADQGHFVFTFHHQANEAWAAVLKTALDAGLYVCTVIPVHAEARSGAHIMNRANISYDAVIVCRKQTQQPQRVNWTDISDRIYIKAERLVRELEQRANGNRIPPEDIYVIVIGKCMEEYSRHYYRGNSYVYWRDVPVGIEEALNGDDDRGIKGIGAIVDQLVEEAEGRMWPAGLDALSRFYVINFLGQTEVPYDRLHRRLQHNPNIDLDRLERRRFISQSKGKVRVLTDKQREDHLMRLMAAEESEQPILDLDLPEETDLTSIDKLHILKLWSEEGRATSALMATWCGDQTFVLLVKAVVDHLDPKHTDHKAYRELWERIGGSGQGQLSIE